MTGQKPLDCHTIEGEEVARRLDVDLRLGLASAEAAARQGVFGRNELPKPPRESLVMLFMKQFKSDLVLILIGAAAASLFAHEYNDAIAIALTLLLNAIFGFEQERRAGRAVDRLKGMLRHEALVVRDGDLRRINSADVVPGDVLVLREGDSVAADARLVELRDFKCNESSLTGESATVAKALAVLPKETDLAEQVNMAWMGTSVVTGQAKAVVTETGANTHFGQIAVSLGEIRRPRAPFEERIGRLGRQLGLVAIGAAAIIFVTGAVSGFELREMFFFTVAMAVSLIPEGLPAVTSVVLAIGVQRMARRRVIVRNLPAVETLGAADIICTDKTGTLTENKMTVKEVVFAGHSVVVSGDGWQTVGALEVSGRTVLASDMPELALLVETAGVVNRASLVQRDGHVEIVGDPTEAALAVLAAKAGLDRVTIEERFQAIDEMPFSSERRFRAVLADRLDVAGRAERRLYVVGAHKVLMRQSSTVLADGRPVPIDDAALARFDAENLRLAGQAMRVLGLAYRDFSIDEVNADDDDVTGLTFLGLVGIVDPPRAGVRTAIDRCREAGIRVMMLTGDQKATAVAIARQVGLIGEGEPEPQGVYSEREVASLDDAAFATILETARVFARVTPSTKLRIVESLRRSGHIVAMTGDGVNDAPALKQSAIGIAMGVGGTDVTREVADMVLVDDAFVSIVNAIEEGRAVFRNVKQVTAYLFTTNIAEAVTILGSMLFGLPLPLLPTQILWMNLVTDSFPGIALATEKPDHDLLKTPPNRRDAQFVTRGVLVLTVLGSAVMCIGTLSLFLWSHATTGDLAHDRTVAFTAMAAFQLWNVFNMRSATESIFRTGIASNLYVLGAVILSLLLQVAVIYLPFLQRIFRTVPLSWREWIVIVLVSSSSLIVVEIYKLAIRKQLIPKSWL